jgi:hypothetical protein
MAVVIDHARRLAARIRGQRVQDNASTANVSVPLPGLVTCMPIDFRPDMTESARTRDWRS